MFLQVQQPSGVLQEVIDSLRQAIVVYGGDGVVHFHNRAAQTLFGPLDGNSVSETLADLGELHALDGTPIAANELPIARLERGEAFRELECLAVDGGRHSPMVLSISGHLIRRLEGDGELRVLIIEDESDRHEREELFRTVFERGPVPVTLVRRSDQCVIDANGALLELLGYDRDEVVGHTVPELEMVLNEEHVQLAMERLDRGEEVERLELVVRSRYHAPRILLSWHRAVAVAGEKCILSVYADITESKEMERKLREATDIVLQSASIFSRNVVQQLERLRAPAGSASATGEMDLLTRRERDVVTRVGAGHSNHRIAEELALTPQTVRNYVTRIYRKIGVGSRAEAVVWARERGLVQG